MKRGVYPLRGRSNSALSRMIVTGPSLRISTRMCAPKRPPATRTPSLRRAFSYSPTSGSASSGGAARHPTQAGPDTAPGLVADRHGRLGHALDDGLQGVPLAGGGRLRGLVAA